MELTITEAIQNLEDIKKLYTWSTGADAAIDMAIEALKENDIKPFTVEYQSAYMQGWREGRKKLVETVENAVCD